MSKPNEFTNNNEHFQFTLRPENKEQAKGMIQVLEAISTCGDLSLINLINRLKEYAGVQT